MRMKRLLLAVLCGLSAVAHAQLTTITASHINMGGVPITTGTVVAVPVNSQDLPISFSTGGGGLNGPTGFTCGVTAGVLSTCNVPDSALTNPANILYDFVITDTSTGNPTSGKSFTLKAVVGVTGTTWPLDQYGPPAPTSAVQNVQVSYGTAAAPSPCISPSIYIRNNSGGQMYACINSVPVLINGAPVSLGTASGTAAAGNDSRIVNSIQSLGGTATPEGQTGLPNQTYAQNINGITQNWAISPNLQVWTKTSPIVDPTTPSVVYAGSFDVLHSGATHAYEMTETSTIGPQDEIGSTSLTFDGGCGGGAPALNGGIGYTFNNTFHQCLGLPTSFWGTGHTYFICFDASALAGGGGSGDQLLGDGTTGNPAIGATTWLAGTGSSIAIFSNGGVIANTSNGLNLIALNTPTCIAVVYDGSGHDQFWQGYTQMSVGLMGNTAQTLTAGHPLGLGGANFGLAGHVYKFAVGPVLAADQIQKINIVFSKQIATALGVPVATTIQNYQAQGTIGIFPGTSRTSGNGIPADSYVTWLVPQLNLPGLVTYNNGIPGQLLSVDISTGIFNNFPTITKNNQAPGAPFPPCFTGSGDWINDISAGQTAAAVYSNILLTIDSYRKAGCVSLLHTILPSQGATSGQNTVRLTVNSDVVNGGNWNFLNDISNDLRFGNPAIAYNLFYANTPYTIDGLHESQYGAQAIANRDAAELLRGGFIGRGQNFQVACPTAYCDIDMRNGSVQQLVLSNNISVLKIINGNQGSILNLTITQAASGGPYTVPTPAVGTGATGTVNSSGAFTLTAGGTGYDQNFMPMWYVTGLTCGTPPRLASTITNGVITATSQVGNAVASCTGTGSVTAISTEPVWSNFNASAVNALSSGKSLTQRFTFDGVGQSIN